MGIQKLGISIAERAASYVRACGKSSVLQTKPAAIVPKPDELGYIFYDRSVNFGSVKAAINYMKNKCVKALQGKNPREYGVEIKGSRIIHEEAGSSNGVWSSRLKYDIAGHGHPDTYAKGCTTAPSVNDYYNLMESESQMKEFVFNSNGEWYVLEKIPKFKFDKDYIFGCYSEIDILAKKHYFSVFPKSVQKELEQTIIRRDVNAFEESVSKYIPDIPADISKDITELTHTFWLKYGERFGVKADTNFSNFKDILT